MNKKLTVFTAFMLVFAAIFIHLSSLFIAQDRIKIAIADEKEVVKCVYLTFDDGPSDRVTPKILDVLDEENVKATFFIIGINAERRRAIIEREYKSGHTVAIHSYTHRYCDIYRSEESLLKDIKACNAVIHSITGEYTNIYRFPGGSFGLSSKLITAVTDSGYRYVDWNASVCDAEILNPTPQQLVTSAITTSSDRDNIVLLAHDSTTKTTTAQALKKIIRYYKQQGYTFERF